MNDLNNLQSEFSLAYVRAVASAAGYFVQETNPGTVGESIPV